MRLYVAIVAICIAALSPLRAIAQEDIEFDRSEIAMSLSSVIAHGTIKQTRACRFVHDISSDLLCENNSPRTISRKIIDLSEIRDTELRPFQNGHAFHIELNVPTQSRWLTITEHKLLGRDRSFERFQERNNNLLEDSSLNSRKEYVYCDGDRNVEKTRDMTLFFDELPDQWIAFERLIEQCRHQ